MLRLAMKNASWVPIAKVLASSTKRYVSVNLSDIDSKTSAGDTVLIPGRVLSSGDITKKVRICSLGISSSAREKLKKTKSEYVSIAKEIQANPKAQGIKVIS